ncbi:signal peptidase I [Brachybacterium sp. P6-10-X1]|uniref:signal peptidase I n=1 Tax=Brachybacterium sp. P6-10-X1 TaxID=1903186 RepID=UPI000971A97B|nr:signal peptidase I [Brachybacterium sp. P6-10-X1]APX33547.1 signal peptidase I [Brachybacterium sp. P6-10-X1]
MTQTTATSDTPVLRRTRPRTRNRTRGALRVLGDVLLWAAAALGLLCAVLAVLTSFLGFQVMLFSSGSMEPTIPVGSAALVRSIEAADVEEGDIVTVDRGAGELPVTHRVVAIDDADRADARLLTLRGDANEQDDPAPYEVTEVSRVVFSVPGIAPLVAQLGTSRMLAPLGMIAAAFVIWGLWPRSPARSRG